MGKNKLMKFAENKNFPHVFQPENNFCEYKGLWKNRFGNLNPLILELGCGKGEYTVALSKKYPQKNFLGIDVKGARIWRGAKTVEEEKIPNAAFLRTRIEFIVDFFDADEVEEIWITFPDPQINKPRKRLTAPEFIERYRQFLKQDGIIHLKTDSRILHDYTLSVINKNNFTLLDAFTDIYAQCPDNEFLKIKTFYEMRFAAQGIPVTYLKFKIS
ncbi:MAG: tRNA (guanosine(46)-N7)-methyltransferase TrmB [Prevotellaceae bacterium]|jgi:tRNA (guanine-N7-)-methyltransferase|nr:tRNA (guanosine(46)-N7)-methyltransferase TrmB [Prevotellaceae bacterium]